jgi:hypothetical protein
MSRTLFAVLAAGVTLAGLVAVVCIARTIPRISAGWTKPVAGLLLLAYGATLVLRPSGWLLTDLAVLTGSVGGVLFPRWASRADAANDDWARV